MYKIYIILISFILIGNSCSKNNNQSNNQIKELYVPNPTDKIWAHRVNSLEGLKKRVDDFKGIEIDIFYNELTDKFDVKHDRDEKGIDLELFLDSILKVKKISIWFDYKNLNVQTNYGVSKLCDILYMRELEKVSFVESYYKSNLEQFNNKLATSFWVSSREIPEEKELRDKLYDEHYKHIKNINVNMLSASYEMFDFLTEYFPSFKCNYWMSGSLTEEKISILNKMALVPNVHVILIDGNKNLLK